MRSGVLPFCAVLWLFAAAPVSHGALVTYSTRALFDGAFPGLAIENFESSTALNGGFSTINAPLNSTTTGVFPAGILAGLEISDRPGPDGGALIAGGAGLFPGSTKNVGANTFADSLDLFFTSGTQAVAFDFLHSPAPGSFSNGQFTIEVFGAGGSLGVFTPTISGIQFFGVSSDADAIVRVNLFSNVNGAEFVDNIAFGAPSEVPEPSTILLTLAGVGILLCRRSMRV